MGLETARGLYDCSGRFAAGRTYVYFFMVRDGDGPMYIKFGRSDDPIQRISGVQTGCPIPIRKAAMIKCLSVDQAKKVEKLLHQEFADRASSGEWFRFDWSSQDERSLVTAKMSVVLDENMRDWRLEPIDLGRAMRMRRALLAERKRRSRANKSRRSKLYRALESNK